MRLRKKQFGFAIISAIFLVVVLAVLGVYMATMSGVQYATTTQTFTASRVYYGAKAGLEWGIHRVIAAAQPCSSLSPAPFALTGVGFEGVSVSVTCNDTSYPGLFYLTVTATYGVYGSPDYSQRVLEATVANFQEAKEENEEKDR